MGDIVKHTSQRSMVTDILIADRDNTARNKRVEIVSGLPLVSRGPAYTCMQLAKGVASPELSVSLHAPIVKTDTLGLDVVPGFVGPEAFAGLAWRVARSRINKAVEANIFSALDRSGDDLVWTFGEIPLHLTRALSSRGVRVVREKFNCAKSVAASILKAEYERCGLPEFTGISQKSIDKEAEEIALAHAIFSPSPMVAASLLSLGFEKQRIIETSYGWEPQRFVGSSRLLPPVPGLTLLFVGTLLPRKGIRVLLEAWAKADIGGRLVLAGELPPDVAQRWGHLIDRPDVIHTGYVRDIGSAFRSADWLVFPSLEEGGPQVTYEAGGCGVPALVTPMGAGAFTRHGQEGLVLDSLDSDDWAELFASLPDRMSEQKDLAVKAVARAKEFTWDSVGKRRRAQLLKLK